MRRYPLSPRPDASPECLADRTKEIARRLEYHHFTDTPICAAIDAVLEIGLYLLETGKAAVMTSEHRAGLLWKVSIRTAMRTARKEAKVCSFAPLVIDALFVDASEADDMALMPCWEHLLTVSKDASPDLFRMVHALLRTGSQRKAAEEMHMPSNTFRQRILSLGKKLAKIVKVQNPSF